jgi:hypothetical protein
MRTPAGAECPFFYGDYFRGRVTEECRLIGNQRPPNNWTPDLCKKCPVPAISRSNACPNMTLYPTIKKGIGKFKRQVKITAFCSKSNETVAVPEIGCSICHTSFQVAETDQN